MRWQRTEGRAHPAPACTRVPNPPAPAVRAPGHAACSPGPPGTWWWPPGGTQRALPPEPQQDQPHTGAKARCPEVVPPWLRSVTFPPSLQGFPSSCTGKVLPVRAGGSLRDHLVAATASPPSTTGKGTPGVPGNIPVPPALLQRPQRAPSQRWGWAPPGPQVPAALSHPFPSDTTTGDRGTPKRTPIPQEADAAHGALHPHSTHRQLGKLRQGSGRAGEDTGPGCSGGSIQPQGGEAAGGTCTGGEECARPGRKLLGSVSAGAAF